MTRKDGHVRDGPVKDAAQDVAEDMTQDVAEDILGAAEDESAHPEGLGTHGAPRLGPSPP